MTQASAGVDDRSAYPMFARSDVAIAVLGALAMAVAGVGSAQWFGLHLADAAHASEPVVEARASLPG